MARSEFLGVDGCRAGWFSVGVDRHGGYQMKVFATFGELLIHYGDAELVLVDIPIGLSQGPGERECDREARKLLGQPRGSSVFRTPTRQTVQYVLENPGDYPGASEVELRFAAGKKLTKQSFGITRKIHEVDQALRARNGGASPLVKEVHPEVLFWGLNDGKPMKFKKSKATGVAERLAVLRDIDEIAQVIYDGACAQFFRKDVARDDILDALAAAVTARNGTMRAQLQTVPAHPSKDAEGLPMEMVFFEARSGQRKDG